MFNLVQTSVYEVVLHGKYLSQDCLNIMHFSGAADDAWVGAGTSQALLDAVKDQFLAEICPELSEHYSVPKMSVKRVSGYLSDGLTPPKFRFSYDLVDEVATPTLVGGVDGNTLPSYAAISCAKRVGLTGRRWMGAARFPGVAEARTENEVDGNYLTINAYDAFVVAWNDFALAPYVVDGNDHAHLGVLSLVQMIFLNPAPGPVANVSLSWRRVSATAVNRYLGSQVSRKVGHGG